MKRIICTLLWILFVFAGYSQIGVYKQVIADTVKAKDYRFSQLPNYSVYGALQSITSGDQNLATPPGTTLQRPIVPSGKIILRFNTDSNALEYGNSSQVWKTIGTSTVQAIDTSSISNFGLKVRSQFSGTSPILYNGITGNISIQQSGSGQAGYLSQADWIAFNAKLPDPGSNGIVVRTAPGTTMSRQLVAGSPNISLVNPSGVSGNPSIDIVSIPTFQNLILTAIPAQGPVADSVVTLNRTTNRLEVHPAPSGGGSGTFNKAGGGISFSGDSLFLNQSFTRGLFSAVSPLVYNSSTGEFSLSINPVLSVTGTTNRITIGGTSTAPTVDIAATYTGQSSITTLGTVTTGIWNGTAIGPTFGGTGQTSVTTGDLLYGSGTNTWGKLAAAATGNVLLSGTTPSWGKVGLTTHVSGILPVANGGTGTATPGIVAGTGISVTGTWPNQTITNTGGGGGGGVSSVDGGYGILGGPITTTGILSVDTSSANSLTTQYDLSFKNRDLKWFYVKDFAGPGVGDSGVDATSALQAAILAAKAHGGGRIYLHNGVYSIKGPVIPTVGGRPCNCQIYIPYSPSDSAITIEFVGETNNMEFQAIGNTGLSSKGGVIIESTLTTASAGDAVIAEVKGPGNGTFDKTNQTDPYFKNITVRTRRDGAASNLALSGINLRYASKTKIDQVRIDVNVPIGDAPDPTGTGSVGIILPEKSNHASTDVGTLRVGGYAVGVLLGEHTVAKDLQIVACDTALSISNGDHSASIQTFEGELNKTNVNVAGDMNVYIANFNTEHYTGSLGAEWYNFISDITFSSYPAYSTIPGTITIGNTNVGVSGTAGTLPSLVTNDSSRIAKLDRTWLNRGVYMTQTPNAGDTANLIRGLNQSTALGMLAGRNSGDGAFLQLRGKTFSAVSGARGNVLIGAGNPSSPSATEGAIRFYTGNFAERMRIKNDGVINIPTLATSVSGDKRILMTDINGDVSLSDILKRNQNAPTGFEVQNPSTGTSAESYLALRNDVGVASMELFSSTNSGAPAIFRTATDAANGMAFATLTNAPIKFLTNSNGVTNEAVRITGSREMLIGSTTDNGAYTLQNTGGFYQNGSFLLQPLTAPTGQYTVLVHGTDSLVHQISPSVFTPKSETYLGTIYNGNSWSNLSEFTQPGGTVGAISGNKINLTGGDGTFSKTLELNYYSVLERWTISSRFVITSAATATSGVGVGLKSVNSYGGSAKYNALARIDLTNTGTAGKLVLNAGNPNTQVAISSDAITFTNGDSILLIAERKVDSLIGFVRNITNGTSIRLGYKYSTAYPLTTETLPNTGRFSVYTFGGTQTIDSLNISSKAMKNANLLVQGDSKTQGYYTTDVDNRFAVKLNGELPTTVLHAGGSDRTTEWLLQLPEIKALSPKQVLLTNPSNDKRSAISDATSQANYQKIVDSLVSWGIDVFHLTAFYETSQDNSGWNNYLAASFASDHIIDVYTATKNGGASMLTADGVHLTDAANDTAAAIIVRSFKIKGGNSNFLTGRGVVNYIPKYISDTKLKPSAIFEDGINTISTLPIESRGTTQSGFTMYRGASGTNEKIWNTFSDANNFYIATTNDARTVNTAQLTINRTGTTGNYSNFSTPLFVKTTTPTLTDFAVQSTSGRTAMRLMTNTDYNINTYYFASENNIVSVNDANNNGRDLNIYAGQFRWTNINSGVFSERMRLTAAGELLINTITDQGAYTIQNNGGLYQNGAFRLQQVTAPPSTYNVLVHSLTDSGVYQIPASALGSSYTFSNGLTNTSGTVTWGGSLTGNTTIAQGGNTVSFTSTINAGTAVSINNSGTTSTGFSSFGSAKGADIQSTALGMNVFGTTQGMVVKSTTDEAIFAQSDGMRAAKFVSSLSTNNTVDEILSLQRAANPGVGANGIGGAITLSAENTSGGQVTTAQLVGKLTTATSGAEVSQFAVVGVNNSVTNTILRIDGDGSFTTFGKRIVSTVTSAASTLTIGNAEVYFFNGTTATWTLPAVSGTAGYKYILKNIGSGAVTLNTAASANELYTTTATNTTSIAANASLTLISNGTYFVVQ